MILKAVSFVWRSIIVSGTMKFGASKHWIVIVLMLIKTTLACRGGTLIRTGVTLDERNQILESHNRLRSTVAQGRVPNQPGAANMREMVWDDELALKAQQWANQCTFQHDPSRYLDRFTMGQNLAIIWSTIPLAPDDGDFPSRIQNWFNEVRKYAWGAQWSPATGHYSQLVWGDTNLVGCGFSYYRDSRRFNKLWVCNYGPGGNVVGSPPYEAGRPSCQNYGMQPSSRYSGLCSSYGAPAASGYNPQSNFIGQNTYTFKTETFNPPTYQVQNTIKTAFQQPYKTFVQPVANSISNGFSFGKNVFDRFKDAVKPPPPSQPQSYHQTQSYQPQSYQQSSYQQASYQQSPQAYQQSTYQQPAYQQNTYQTSAYHQQPKSQSPFLTYDWSQLFSVNNNYNNYQTKK
ncbi:hypothetical protein HA402_015712 [Bradysia odoriphaga]|nr:hypothetical protein HA402_015712 [Bradysia odoriphaga]